MGNGIIAPLARMMARLGACGMECNVRTSSTRRRQKKTGNDEKGYRNWKWDHLSLLSINYFSDLIGLWVPFSGVVY